MNKIYNINDRVMIDNKYECIIYNIVTEDNIIYYEVAPIDFNSFTRFVTIAALS